MLINSSSAPSLTPPPPPTGRWGPSHRLDAIYPHNILTHIYSYSYICIHCSLCLECPSFLHFENVHVFWFPQGKHNDIWVLLKNSRDFPGGSNGKESACNAGNLGSISGSGSSPGKGSSYPLQYSWLENPMDREVWRDTVHGVAKSHDWVTSTFKEFQVQLVTCFFFFLLLEYC